jgi:PAS domain S-box-containing protein
VTIEHLASIVENTSDAVVSTDTQDIIKSWNKGAENLFGYSAEEIVGKTIVVLIPSNLKSEENEILDRVRNGERIEPYETQRLRKDGTPVDVSLTVSPILDGDHRIVSKIARDITERKRSEAALSNQARQQAALHRLTERLHRARRIEEAYEAALDAIQAALEMRPGRSNKTNSWRRARAAQRSRMPCAAAIPGPQVSMMCDLENLPS